MPEPADRLLTLTAEIAAAYVSAHAVTAMALPGLIRDIHRSLVGLALTVTGEPAKPRLAGRAPGNIRQSVFADHLVCLEDGLSVTILKRHLRIAHQLTPEGYRAKWGLPGNYPMVAPAYAKMRSTMAKANGLGRKSRWSAAVDQTTAPDGIP
jgi:predicted transcriptional regulator